MTHSHSIHSSGNCFNKLISEPMVAQCMMMMMTMMIRKCVAYIKLNAKNVAYSFTFYTGGVIWNRICDLAERFGNVAQNADNQRRFGVRQNRFCQFFFFKYSTLDQDHPVAAPRPYGEAAVTKVWDNPWLWLAGRRPAPSARSWRAAGGPLMCVTFTRELNFVTYGHRMEVME